MARAKSSPQRALRRRRCAGDGGAALVEFALIMPVLFLIIFGVIEFGSAFFQSTDVRHGARETSRLVAVNYKASAIPGACTGSAGQQQTCALILDACLRMDAGSSTRVSISSSGAKTVGSPATITVSRPLVPLTGFMNAFLPSTLDDTIITRLELPGTWENTAPRTCP